MIGEPVGASGGAGSGAGGAKGSAVAPHQKAARQPLKPQVTAPYQITAMGKHPLPTAWKVSSPQAQPVTTFPFPPPNHHCHPSADLQPSAPPRRLLYTFPERKRRSWSGIKDENRGRVLDSVLHASAPEARWRPEGRCCVPYSACAVVQADRGRSLRPTRLGVLGSSWAEVKLGVWASGRPLRAALPPAVGAFTPRCWMVPVLVCLVFLFWKACTRCAFLIVSVAQTFLLSTLGVALAQGLRVCVWGQPPSRLPCSTPARCGCFL